MPAKSSTSRDPRSLGRIANLGPALRTLRKQRALSQEAVARTVGVDRSEVGAWENGRRLPTVARLDQLATLYRIHLGDLDEALDRVAAGGSRLPPRKPARPPGEQLAELVLPPGRRARPEDLELFDRFVEILRAMFASRMGTARKFRKDGSDRNGDVPRVST